MNMMTELEAWCLELNFNKTQLNTPFLVCLYIYYICINNLDFFVLLFFFLANGKAMFIC